MKFALSSKWLAQTLSSQVTIRDATHGRLQCTLRSKQKPEPQQLGGAVSAVLHHNRIRRLTVNVTILVGEVTTGDAEDTTTAMVWDLTRGVVAFEVTGIRSACTGRRPSPETTTHPNLSVVYVLKQKENTEKLIIYEYSTGSTSTSGGTIVRKVKAGKMTSPARGHDELFVTDDLLVVVQHETSDKISWRMMDITSGSKVAKASTGMVHQITTIATNYAFGILASSKSLFCLNLKTGTVAKLPTTLPIHDSNNIQQLQVAERDSGGIYLLVNNSQLYTLEHCTASADDNEDNSLLWSTATLHCKLPTTNSSNNNNIVNLLHSDRLIAVDENGTIHRIYLDLETLPKEVMADSVKNDNKDDDHDSIMKDAENVPVKRKSHEIVLGPGQAGSLSKADVEPPSSKNKRSKTTAVVSDTAAASDHMVDEPTIAERLLQLEQAVDEIEASEEDYEKNQKDMITANLTTESLYQLLSQALQSGDKNLLETALRVNDVAVIQATCRELNPAQAQKLVYCITDRIAARPNRGERLAAWLSGTISSTKNPEDLKPLYNLIQDRLQVYPRLMQLQGRLHHYLECSPGPS